VDPQVEDLAVPAPGVLDAFCEAFNAGDIDRLTALLLDTASVEVVGATVQFGPAAAKATVLFGLLFGSERMANADTRGGMEARFIQGVLPEAPRVEARLHRGRWLLLHWYRHRDGEAVRAITRVEPDGDRITHLANYFFTPDFIGEVCGELGVPFRAADSERFPNAREARTTWTSNKEDLPCPSRSTTIRFRPSAKRP
jgi:RNA polymerase sigma-70 factor (ECF subfamily)